MEKIGILAKIGIYFRNVQDRFSLSYYRICLHIMNIGPVVFKLTTMTAYLQKIHNLCVFPSFRGPKNWIFPMKTLMNSRSLDIPTFFIHGKSGNVNLIITFNCTEIEQKHGV